MLCVLYLSERAVARRPNNKVAESVVQPARVKDNGVAKRPTDVIKMRHYTTLLQPLHRLTVYISTLNTFVQPLQRHLNVT